MGDGFSCAALIFGGQFSTAVSKPFRAVPNSSTLIVKSLMGPPYRAVSLGGVFRRRKRGGKTAHARD